MGDLGFQNHQKCFQAIDRGFFVFGILVHFRNPDVKKTSFVRSFSILCHVASIGADSYFAVGSEENNGI